MAAAPLAATSELLAATEPFFAELVELGEFVRVDRDELPGDYRTLLAHDAHMTVSVERFHGSPVDVQVLQERRQGDSYARTSLLTSGDRRLQFGIMQIDTRGLPDVARAAILSGAEPLGRILIRHNVLRRVELVHLWRVTPGPALRLNLSVPASPPIYGRSARILVGGRPAVRLLEIVAL